jgi:DNA-binding transcriptional MerR regulator
MTISQAARKSGLTKKALQYYEEQNLICPGVGKNGYRDYSGETYKRIKIIAALRELSFSVKDIRVWLDDDSVRETKIRNKIKEVEEIRNSAETLLTQLKQIKENKITIELAAKNYRRISISSTGRKKYLAARLNALFPGGLGLLMSKVYGNVLDPDLNDHAQRAAWVSMIDELDGLDAVIIPDDIAEWAAAVEAGQVKEWTKEFNSRYAGSFQEGLADMQGRMKGNHPPPSGEVLRLTEFLAKDGAGFAQVIGKYLPILSSSFRHFAEAYSQIAEKDSSLPGANDIK